MLKNSKKIILISAIMFCAFLVFGCSKTELDVEEGDEGKIEESDVKSQLENILKENNIDGEIVEYKQINNAEELAKKYPVLYEGLPNGVYEVRTKGFRLMVDIKER